MHKLGIVRVLITLLTVIAMSYSVAFADQGEALMNAAKEGDLKQVQELLKEGADANAKNKYGKTALMYAADKGHLGVVKLLLNKGANVNARQKEGGTALMSAALSGHAEVAKLLLEQGAEFDVKGQKTMTALFVAALDGHLEMVKLLLEKGVDINSGHGRALINAVDSGNVQIVKLLLESGADVNTKDDSNTTVLMNAAGKGGLEITKLLLDRGAGVNAKDNSNTTALIFAVGGHFEIVNMLRDKGTDDPKITEFMNLIGKGPLPKDIFGKDRLAIVNLLLDKRADVNAKDKLGRTALKFAQERGQKAIVKLLKAHGATE